MRSLWSLLTLSLRTAWRERRLAILLWALHFALALVAIAPVAGFLDDALASAPEADRFLARCDLPLFADLLEQNRAAAMALAPILGVATALALLLNAFSAGGALEVLLFPDHRRLALRFTRGGGRQFGRFVRMGMAAVPTAIVLAAIVSAPLWIARGALSFRAEGVKFFLGLAAVAVAAVGALVVLLALDLARIGVVRTDDRRAVRRFLRTLLGLLRRPSPALGLWAGLAAPLALAGLLLLALRSTFAPSSALLLLAMVFLQQLTIAARAFYRVALWAGEATLSASAESSGPRTGA